MFISSSHQHHLYYLRQSERDKRSYNDSDTDNVTSRGKHNTNTVSPLEYLVYSN